MARTKTVPGRLTLYEIKDMNLVSYRLETRTPKNKRDRLVLYFAKDIGKDLPIVQLVHVLNEYALKGEYVVYLCCRRGETLSKEQVLDALKLKNHSTTDFFFYDNWNGIHSSLNQNYPIGFLTTRTAIYPELSAKYNLVTTRQQTELAMMCLFSKSELFDGIIWPIGIKRVIRSFLLLRT